LRLRRRKRPRRNSNVKGAVINSHTRGQYLDDQKFWPIFEAAEALNVPIYIHPNTPPREMIGPLLARGLDGAIYGFAVECGMHLLTIIASGVFDRFPKLQMVFGDLGEGLPFWMFRLDFMHRAQVSTKRYQCLKPLKRKISYYMRGNVYYTTSGMAWEPAIMFTRAVVGADRVLYAMDYPYQYVPEEVAAMERMPLSEHDKKARFFRAMPSRSSSSELALDDILWNRRQLFCLFQNPKQIMTGLCVSMITRWRREWRQ
jgi:5-carboxyvanillate decarboxylase